jgi:hypothetical protein
MIRCGDERGSSQPRIFVSYARSDGGALSHALHRRLEQEAGFSLWQDLADLEGGKDWESSPPSTDGDVLLGLSDPRRRVRQRKPRLRRLGRRRGPRARGPGVTARRGAPARGYGDGSFCTYSPTR